MPPCFRALLAAAALVAAPAGAAPITTVFPDETVPAEPAPPPGAAPDQALWSSGRAAYADAIVAQEQVRRLVNRLRGSALYDRLSAAKAAAPAEGARADALTREVAAAAEEAYRRAAAPPRDLRTGCRYELLRLESAMAPAAGTAGRADLPAFRKELADCRDQVNGWTAPVKASAGKLSQALDAAEAWHAARPGGAAAGAPSQASR